MYHRGMSDQKPPDQLLLAEMQVLLAQLRTQLSIVRAGMALFGGAVTVYFVLEANQWNVFGIDDFILEAKLALGVIALLGLWRFMSAERKIVLVHKLIHKAEGDSKLIDELMV